MKKLEEFETRDGNDYTLLKRTENVACYITDRKGIRLGYAVFIVKEQKPMEVVMKGIPIKYEHKEILPGASAYGLYAWFYQKPEHAEQKFNELLKHEQEKALNKAQKSLTDQDSYDTELDEENI